MILVFAAAPSPVLADSVTDQYKEPELPYVPEDNGNGNEDKPPRDNSKEGNGTGSIGTAGTSSGTDTSSGGTTTGGTDGTGAKDKGKDKSKNKDKSGKKDEQNTAAAAVSGSGGDDGGGPGAGLIIGLVILAALLAGGGFYLWRRYGDAAEREKLRSMFKGGKTEPPTEKP